MAKRKAAKVAKVEAVQVEDVGTVTYSTRFTSGQREVIEKAAGLAGWSPAKFIREASVSRAVDVVNASGSAGNALRLLAAGALRQLMRPVIDAREKAALEEFERGGPMLDPEDFPKPSVGEAELYEMKRALETSSTEFVRLMLDQWDMVFSGTGGYSPTVSATELLKGGDE